ncbi:MAG: AMP-binding protein, partial [Candidatus Wenzhouxiangella sp. M2_3B_020]
MSGHNPLKERYPVFESIAENAHVDADRYEQLSRKADEDPEAFWGDVGKRIDWIKPFSRVKDVSFSLDDLHIRWYDDGTLNVCHNCVDRHLEDRGDQVAILWEGDDPARDAKITYRELHERVCKFANVLKKHDVKKGDRVTLYLPMIPEAAVAMLACARIGAIHSVVFGGFSPDALAGRIIDCDSRIVVTADCGVRGGRSTGLKKNVDAALKNPEAAERVESVLVVRNTGDDIAWDDERDHWLHEELEQVDAECEPEEMEAEDPLFILYTSG